MCDCNADCNHCELVDMSSTSAAACFYDQRGTPRDVLEGNDDVEMPRRVLLCLPVAIGVSSACL
jgi:hypothetical protein